jgi:hypothetical protein
MSDTARTPSNPIPPRGPYRDPRDEAEPETEVTTREARSGDTSGHVRRILGISLSLTAIGMALVLIYWFVST